MTHIAMLLSNAFRPDPRVLKEAAALAAAGYAVTVIAWDREGKLPPQEQVDGFTVRRVPDVRSSSGAGPRQRARPGAVFTANTVAVATETPACREHESAPGSTAKDACQAGRVPRLLDADRTPSLS